MKLSDRVVSEVLEDTSMNGAKFSALDGLRGIAVLTVFLSHSSGFRQRITPWTSFHGTGHIGVYLFFVLSGFLLCVSLLGSRTWTIPGFYIRRFLRIAPLFYLVVAAVFSAQLLTGGVDLFNLHVKNGWHGFLGHLLFVQGDSVFWTIAAEFQFYVILPFVTMALSRWGGKAALMLCTVALAYFAYYILLEMELLQNAPPLKAAIIVHKSQFWDVFLCGVLAAWAMSQPAVHEGWEKIKDWVRGVAWVMLAVATGLALLFASEDFFGFGRNWRNSLDWWARLGLPEKFGPGAFSLPYGLAFAWITLAMSMGAGPLQRVCEWKVLRWIGVTGFSWYLLHFPIMRFSNWLTGLPGNAGSDVPWSWKEPTAFAISFVLTATVATVAYLLVEKPFIMLSRTLVRRRPNPA